MKKLILFTVVLSGTLFSCKTQQLTETVGTRQKQKTPEMEGEYVPLTSGLIKKYSLKEEHLSKLQYQVSGTIVLSTEMVEKELVIEGGVLVSVTKKKPTSVIIPSQTEGVYAGSPQEGVIGIRFAQEGESRVLYFMPGPTEGRYVLAGKPVPSGIEVSYDGRKYIADVTSSQAFLNIFVSETLQVDPQKRIEKGVKLNDGGTTASPFITR